MPSIPRRAGAATLFAALAALLLCSAPSRAQALPGGFAEEFVLTDDRGAAVERLIPGTQQAFLYACLLAQHEGRFAAVPPLLESWIQAHGRTAGVVEIENRQALLRYEADPEAAYRLLRDRLGLRFDHQRQVPGVDPELPTALDPRLLEREQLVERALRNHPRSVAGFRGRALWEIAAGGKVPDQQLGELLNRLGGRSSVAQDVARIDVKGASTFGEQLPGVTDWLTEVAAERAAAGGGASLEQLGAAGFAATDLPNLAELVVRQLRQPRAGSFGSLNIHYELLLEQLEECARLQPELLGNSRFVALYVRRLAPSADVDWRTDASARAAWFDRLDAFTRRLPPVHTALRAHVLYHRLNHELEQGRFDRALFLEYLRLPRQRGYVARDLLAAAARRRQPVAKLGERFPTGLPAIGDDEALVIRHLEHFLLTAEDTKAFAEFVGADWLRRVFATTKILNGIGDMERWYALIDDPAWLEQLRSRIELRFAPGIASHFDVDAAVTLPVDVKNIDTLLVKVFEVDPYRYLQEHGKPVDVSIELDGLIAGSERTLRYDDPPLRRMRRDIPLPSVGARRGVWVVELIGGGVSSRAVIRKGGLHGVERVTGAGHVFRVFDQAGDWLRDATIQFGGREYQADERGEILLPFSTKPGRKAVILRHRDFAEQMSFDHRAESYALDSGAFVAREALVRSGRAELLLRPVLELQGRRASLSALEDVVLRLVATDRDGIETTDEVRGVALRDGHDFVHSLRVPESLARLTVELYGEVQSLTGGSARIRVAAPVEVFNVNGIDATPATGAALLGRTAAGYHIDVLGKDGEPRGDVAVALRLDLVDFADALDVTLRTDEAGRVALGTLSGVRSVRCSLQAGLQGGFWSLLESARSLPLAVQGAVGDVLRVPFGAAGEILRRGDVALYELREGLRTHDRFANVAQSPGYLELRGLGAGDYELVLRSANRAIQVRVVAGATSDGLVVGGRRALQQDTGSALQVLGIEADGEDIVIRLSGVDAHTRLQLHTSRYLPGFHPFASVSGRQAMPPVGFELPQARTDLAAGRRLSDEYRYILERRLAKRFPGNMLERPSLLLNPWDLEETLTELGLGGDAGGRFGGRAGRRGTAVARVAPNADADGGVGAAAGANLDFLGASTPLLADLRPDESGVVRIARADLGDGALLHVLAQGATSVVYRSLPLAERALEPRAGRLAKGLDPATDHAQIRGMRFVAAGESVVLDDVRAGDLRVYDDLASIFQLFRTISGDAEQDRFEFLPRWAQLDPAAKLAMYDEFACHELHVFLHEKDPEFFAQIVRPYLQNKLHRTFLDDWLLEADLSGYLDPWEFERLNVVERILLARRVTERLEGTRQAIEDRVELQAQNAAELGRMVRYALAGRTLALDTGVADDLHVLRERLQFEAAKLADPAQRPARGRVRDRAGEDEARLEALEEAEDADPAESKESAFDSNQWNEAIGLGADQKRRKQMMQQQLYRGPAVTRRYVEQNYWRLPIAQHVANRVESNRFWADFAAAASDRAFCSDRLLEVASGTLTERLLALAFLDLPFDAAEHESNVEGSRYTLRAGSPLLATVEQVQAVAPSDAESALLVRQHLFRLDEPTRIEGGRQVEAWLDGELLAGVAYGCRVVLTNPDSLPLDLEVLLQIPAGAVPVNSGFVTRGIPVQLQPYATTTLEYAFYFPVAGEFSHYPARVARDGQVMARAVGAPTSWTVRDEPSRADETSWAWISQNATGEALLDHLSRANLFAIDLGQMAWRMRDGAFFQAATARLRERQVYHDTLWSYGVLHRDALATGEYLRHQGGFVAACGPALESPLLTIDPVQRRSYEFAEYRPLFNARAHRFAGERRILNGSVAAQYRSLLNVLTRRPAPSAEDRASLTYYLLLQDRIGEALAQFERIDPRQLRSRIQYDYMSAYLAFFTETPETAREIATRHAEHPVAHWRSLFTEVLRQLDEAAGTVTVAAAEGSDDAATDVRRATELADRQPTLDLQIDGESLELRSTNLERVQIAYYRMDVEFLFSAQPFVQQGGGSFSGLRPNRSELVALDADGLTVAVVPEDLRSANLLIEVRGAGIVRRASRYANALDVRWLETAGQLQVVSPADAGEGAAGRPLSKVYVKVFAREPGGAVRFHKDGYTDLRGRFDYASVSGQGAMNVERFAVLVFSEAHGAVIRELAPPAR